MSLAVNLIGQRSRDVIGRLFKPFTNKDELVRQVSFVFETLLVKTTNFFSFQDFPYKIQFAKQHY